MDAEANPPGRSTHRPFVRVSPRDPRYFELSDGRPYIPIGLNLIRPPEGGDLDGMERWLKQLSANGGNYARIWLSSPFFDVEHARSGQYDARKARRIDRLLDLGDACGIYLKLCVEHFRHFGDGKRATAKPLHLQAHGGPARDIADFLDGQRSREQFKRKLDWFAARYGDRPGVFGWELWNEIDAVHGGDFIAWTEAMLPELHRRFPRNLGMQSLGSLDHAEDHGMYRRMAVMAGNDVAQVHRYLDLGAGLDVCRGPVDILATDAVDQLRSVHPARPILLAESGAVEPRHTGPSRLYQRDTAGILLHDVLFAPFFAGAAGPGHIWHWDRYVDPLNLWHHFGRFAEVVRGLDPPAERFAPLTLPHERLRVRVLRGRRTLLAWCRDTDSTWMSELRDARPPRRISDAVLELGDLAAGVGRSAMQAYDPWSGEWSEAPVDGGQVRLPPLTRSIVLRAALEGGAGE